MKRLLFLALCGVMAGALLAKLNSAHALEAFKKEFDNKYVKKDGTTDAEKNLAAAAEKAKCNICHVGKSKKARNEYGKALSTLLTKKDAKNSEKIQKALDDIATMKSDPKDASSPTFGELISEGKLPGGDPAAAAPAAGN
ncbi:MAG TPA: hypothetical protein VHV08_07645 [Pirellulales bacterium]|nr:hypothetical protein [Pirellulales bacterium]